METSQLVPSGTLRTLNFKDVVPSPNNPRQLFDPEPLFDLRENIRRYGVLVPITVFPLPGSDKFGILDGARRHRCCEQLAEEGIIIGIPANIVEPPDKLAGLLYMFSIHNFREAWELMPTALGLKTVIDETQENDTKRLSILTGLSEPQVERCKVLLNLPEEFQELSLDPDPKNRVPSNFWIEALPIVEQTRQLLPDLYRKHHQPGLLRLLVAKYRAKKIKSVIHFRRISEALENSKDNNDLRANVVTRLQEYFENTDLETRAAFDEFVMDARKIRTAVSECEKFADFLQTNKLFYAVDADKDQITAALQFAKEAIEALLIKLEGTDAPALEEGGNDAT